MPSLNFNALIPQGPRSVAEGFNLGQEQRNQMLQQQQARQLGDIQLQNALREQQTAAAEQEAYKGAADLEDARKRLMSAGLGKQSAALQKQIDEQRTAKLTQAKTQVDLIKSTANQIFTNPQNAVQILTSFNQRTGIDISDDLAQLQQLGGNPEAVKQWAAGHVIEADKMLPKFQEFSTPGGGKQLGTVNPMTGAFTATTTMAPQMTPGELAADARARETLAQNATSVVYQPNADNQIIALPSKLKKGEVPVARVAVAPGGGFQPLQGKPSEAEGREIMSLNQQKAVLNGALKQVQANPSAFGAVRGAMGETLGGRYYDTPEEAQARAYAFNVVSSVIHARAGTAQTPGERETLLRFLPGEYDDAKQVENKINAYLKYVGDMESGTTKKRGGASAPTLAPVDQQALQWANSNPADPRAAAIKQRLGM